MTSNDRTFHLFVKLPPELRHEIWKMAMRPDLPGAHFFTAFEYDNEKSSIGGDGVTLRGQHVDGVETSLAAPRCDKADPERRSWTNSNPSTYLIDSGLWTACHESRIIMQMHIKRAELAARRIHAAPRDPGITARITADGEKRFCKLYPDRDLFCLQPLDFRTLPWDRLHGNTLMLLLGKRTRHVALEFDPQWGEFEWEKCHAIANIRDAVVDDLHWSDNLWFIDYSLARCGESPRTMDESEDRAVFHGNGCRFVEVRRDDPGWNGGKRPVFDFIDELMEFQDDQAIWVDSFNQSPQQQPVYLDQPELRVLACESTS
ncbi:hypothetical protein F4780DRAFT_8877 [Xylariomycetidae sp. FL0641]|nr:hypothetical protein F4780DRAFT_8877 [Xylariomycetidae sp. FL0641]